MNAECVVNGTNIYNNSTGNVGIGTINPVVPLHVSSVMTSGVISELSRLEIRGKNDNELREEGRAISFYTPVSPASDVLGLKYNGSISDKIVKSASGNVGIGTSDGANWNLANSSYKLAVGGSIIASSLNIKTVSSWSDYVFKEKYHLLPLGTVKKFIEKYQHLPDVPAETEVKESGINVGEMNAILLRKIEELTLYLIEKDKEIKDLRNDVEKIKARRKTARNSFK